jgi:1-deoxy-D-xylulose-5-phosphate reductoisomerase
MKKRIAILGSTGSIGTQALEVINQHPENFELEVITAHSNANLLIEQAIKFKPNAVVIANDKFYNKVFNALNTYDIKVFSGNESISQIIEMDSIDIILVALVGYAGLKPTLKAIEKGKQIALANKESLVVAGKLITESAKKNGVNIIPVDSEHSAIFQCLAGESFNPIEKIYLTASGGPFRGKENKFLKNVKKEQALKHPNIHPQSIIHSIVQFCDGSMKAQMGLPDMKLPIQYALSFPFRIKSDFPRFSFFNYPELTFEAPDFKIFRNLALAFEAVKMGGNIPCILNAANEIVVEAFLNDKIGFLRMPDIIEKCMQTINFIKDPSYEDYVFTDNETRIKALSYIR